jgi:hypothetical protein
MEKHNVFPVDFENATIAFRNFAGVGSRYNKEGDHNFVLIIDDEATALDMFKDGWNVKAYVNDDSLVSDLLNDGWDSVNVKPNLRNEIEFRLTVAVNFNTPPNMPPVMIFTYVNGVETRIFEDTVGELDSAVLQNIDLTIRPRWWQDDKTGDWRIKAYLKEARITLEASRWADKYAAYHGE